MKDILDLIGRILLGFIFLFDAYDSIFFFAETKTKMLSYGLSWNPNFLLVSSIVLLSLGGILLVTGYRVRLGVILLLMYWIPVTFIIHPYWSFPPDCVGDFPCSDQLENYRRLQSVLFTKNLAIIGGLLLVYTNGIHSKFRIRRIFATARVPGA